jgi:hypothetical protein
MLDPSTIMRPDGVYIGNNIFKVDDYWTLLISAKIHQAPISGIGVDKRTTDWKYLYFENSEDENTHRIKKHIIRGRLDKICNKYNHLGSLRIHFILPSLAKSKDNSDRGGCRVEGKDIIMYIDQNLLMNYFKNPQYINVMGIFLNETKIDRICT